MDDRSMLLLSAVVFFAAGVTLAFAPEGLLGSSPATTAVKAAHLLCFATSWGATVWAIFVGGLVMFLYACMHCISSSLYKSPLSQLFFSLCCSVWFNCIMKELAEAHDGQPAREGVPGVLRADGGVHGRLRGGVRVAPQPVEGGSGRGASAARDPRRGRRARPRQPALLLPQDLQGDAGEAHGGEGAGNRRPGLRRRLAEQRARGEDRRHPRHGQREVPGGPRPVGGGYPRVGRWTRRALVVPRLQDRGVKPMNACMHVNY